MVDLLSFIAPKHLTAELVRHSIGTADMIANKYRAQTPDDVGIAWREHLRPALVRWSEALTAQEKPR